MSKQKNIFYIAIGVLSVLLIGYFLIAKHFIIVPHGVELFFLISFSALLDSINPCAFSILFLTIGFLFSLGRDRENVFKAGLMYVFGIMATYVLIGLGILRVLSFFNVPNGMAKLGAMAIIVFGAIGLINEFFPKFPIKLKIPHSAHLIIAKYIEKASMVSSFILGIAVGLFEFPCTGGPYLLVLGLLHDQGQFWSGLMYLLFYNVVFVLPLFVALLLSVDKRVADKIDVLRRQETKQARLAIALIMIILGLIIFFV
ncbi:MAG: cytochrome c biogenesis protein CcdA [bacterium]